MPYPTKWGQCPDCKPEAQKATVGDSERDRVANIPPKYKESRGGRFPAQIDGKANEFAAGSIDGLFIFGATGTGKTYLATACLQRWSKENGKSGTWQTAARMLMEIRATFRDGSREDESAIVERYVNASCLLIDDLGAEKVTDWSTSTLTLILADRINEGRPTIVTSNNNLAQLAQWSDRIASRLSGYQCIQLAGKDRRAAR